MVGEQDGRAGLGWLDGQRNRLADRVRAPWWYLVGYLVIWCALVGWPFLSRLVDSGLVSLALVAAVGLAYLLQWALDRTTGVAVRSNRTADRFPSTRWAAAAMLLVGVVANTAEVLLLRADLLMLAVVVAVLAIVVGPACQLAVLRGVRRDLRTGVGSK